MHKVAPSTLVACCCFTLFIFFFAERVSCVYEPYGINATCVHISQINQTMGLCYPVIAPHYQWVYSDANDATRALWFNLQTSQAGLITRQCNKAGLVMSCMARWRECIPIDVSANFTDQTPTSPNTTTVTIQVARDMCFQTCQNWLDACESSRKLAEPGINKDWQLLNCTPLSHDVWGPNVVDFLRRTDALTIPFTDPNGQTILYDFNTTCNYIDYLNVSLTASRGCPAPLIPDPNTGWCTVGCPLPLISDNDYEALEITMDVLGWLSFVLTAFLIATYMLDPQRRGYPAVLPLFFIICTNATSFAFCLGSMVGHKNVWCASDGSPHDFGGAACTVQGIIWVYFTLAAVLWWLMIVINLLVMLVVPNALKRVGRWHYLYHFVWLAPLITLIISLSAEKLGYGGDVWCSVHIGDPFVSFEIDGLYRKAVYDEYEYLWNLLLIVVPILVVVTVGVLIVTGILIFMVINWKRFGLKYLFLQWRLFLFTFFYIYIYTFLFAFEIERIVQTEDQYDSFLQWITCWYAQTALEQAGLFGIVTCDLKQEVSFPLWYIVVFNASVQGIVVFFIFGTSWRMYLGWYYLFRHPKKVWSKSSAEGSTESASGIQKVEGRTASSSNNRNSNRDEMMNSISSSTDTETTTITSSDSESQDEGDHNNSEEEGQEMEEYTPSEN